MYSRRTDGQPRTSRSGVTLLEVLVVIAIVGMLVSLFMPAVANSREAARATQCRARERLIGIALTQYQSDYRVYPPGAFGVDLAALQSTGTVRIDVFSAYARLLPYMNQPALYRRVKWTANWDDPNIIEGGPVDLPELRCPTDANHNERGASFGLSAGALPSIGGPLPSTLEQLAGAFPAMFPIGPHHFRDGLSHTAALSDIRSGTAGPYDAARHVVTVADPGPPGMFPDYWVNACSSVSPPILNWDASHGHSWWLADSLFYNHILPPNTSVIDCGYRPGAGLLAARSDHRNSVHTLMMDGAVRIVSNAIDVQVWQSLGTRIGGESTNE